MTGTMRYYARGAWYSTGYSLTAMCYVIENDYPYELEGRDY